MILADLKIAGADMPVNIRTDGSKISAVSSRDINADADEQVLSFADAIVFPGLINSHDHLDFNLFPRLGDRHYSNYIEWGNHIHRQYKSEIDQVLRVPQVLRYEWGVFKNLLCGVTTVVNHGETSGLGDDLITIHERSRSLHSVGFEKNWRFKLNNPFNRKQPVNIHVGEGDDWSSFSEINSLTSWNLLRRELIGIHGVSMTERQARKFKALVWCPQTNYFMLNKTALVDLLQNHTTILFGTDSTLTADWDVWSHLRTARQSGMVSDEALYHTLNKNAADVWGLNTGKLEAGKDADIVIARARPGLHGYNAFYALQPADLLLVMHRGNIRLFDESFSLRLPPGDIENFSRVEIGGAAKYVQGNLPGLMEQIHKYYPANFPVDLTYAT